MGGGHGLISATQPARPVTRSSLRLSITMRVEKTNTELREYKKILEHAWGCAVVDKKDHTTGAIH